eukprot:jgi/Phyca11/120476/e_gw1.41.247.1
MYLVAVFEAYGGGADFMVLNNIIQYASTELWTVLMAKADGARSDYLQHAEELAHFAQAWELEPEKQKKLGQGVVNHVGEHRREPRRCRECGEVGHLRAACPAILRAKGRNPRGTLVDFHQRLGHLNYDTVERLGKHAKNRQSGKDTGDHSPIHRMGGTNDAVAKQFEQFLVFFEKRFNCRIHVLRTGSGGEYQNVDLFCKKTGVVCQRSEVNNPASNGKAERMHRTIMNMARCMVFACGMPLSFWGGAVQYAAYILNRSPTNSNPGRASPVKVLTKDTPSLGEIFVFGSPCTVYREPKNKTFSHRALHGMIVGIGE